MKIFYFMLLLGLVHCSDDVSFVAKSSKRGKGSSIGNEALGNAEGTQTIKLSFGPKASPTDFLLIVDNSGSMRNSRKRINEGLTKISKSNWPVDSKIGIMSTMPGSFTHVGKVHEDVTYYGGIDEEPGFLSLVDKGSIDHFRANSPAEAGAFALDGCDKWFSPGEKNTHGYGCLEAHLQSPLGDVECEAGLTALRQLLELNKNKGLFRMNAFVHIIFISDTHDPGCFSQELLHSQPKHEDLAIPLRNGFSISGYKIHGLVPFQQCQNSTETPIDSLSYLSVIKQTDGKALDFCTTSDYSSLVEQVIFSATPDPVFELPSGVKKLTKVDVDGNLYKGRIETLGKNKYKLTDLELGKDHELTFSFK